MFYVILRTLECKYVTLSLSPLAWRRQRRMTWSWHQTEPESSWLLRSPSATRVQPGWVWASKGTAPRRTTLTWASSSNPSLMGEQPARYDNFCYLSAEHTVGKVFLLRKLARRYRWDDLIHGSMSCNIRGMFRFLGILFLQSGTHQKETIHFWHLPLMCLLNECTCFRFLKYSQKYVKTVKQRSH